MPTKNTSKSNKKDSKNKIVMQRWEELLKWKVKNATQKRFFSLEEKEQSLLEKTYLVFAQVCLELTWEDYLSRLSKTDKYDSTTKAVVKKVIWMR